MQIGFIGLGAMGVEMVRNLLKAGFDVCVFNRSQPKMDLVAAEGALPAASLEEAAANPLVFTMLADDAATEATVLDSGFLDALPEGGVHVCCATISAALASRMALAHAAHGRAYVSAPVFGRPPAAAAAQLFVVAAGDAGTIARCEPAFNAIGQRTFVVGDAPEAANVVKISGNFMIAAMNEALGEACALTRKYGVDATQFIDLMTSSIFNVPVYKIYGGLIASGKYEPAGFPLRLGLKDVRLALAAAEAKEIALPLASLARDNYLKAITRGYAEYDWAALGLVAQEDAGLS